MTSPGATDGARRWFYYREFDVTIPRLVHALILPRPVTNHGVLARVTPAHWAERPARGRSSVIRDAKARGGAA